MQISFFQVAKFVWSYLRRHPAWLAGLFLILLLQSASEIAMPYLIGIFTDYLTDHASNPAEAIGGAFALIGWIAAAGLIFWFLNQSGKIFYDYTKTRILKKNSTDAFARVQRFSTDWHVNSFAGATVRKIGRGVWAFNTFVDQFYFGFAPLTFLIIGMTVMMTLRWQMMGVLLAVGSLVYAGVSIWLTRKFIAPTARAAAGTDTRYGAVLADAISCNSTVKIFGRENFEDQIFARAAEKWKHNIWRMWTTQNSVGFVQALIMTLLKLGMFAFVVWLWARGVASVGEAVFVFASYNLISSHLRGIGERIREVQQATNEMEDLVEFSLKTPKVADRANAQELKVSRGAIEFSNVTFRYANQKRPIYRQLSLQIKPGEKIALVGHSGGGKTTFVKLLQRLYDIRSGSIKIDGQNIARVTQKSLRRAVGLVPQEPLLFHRSLAENIAYGRPRASFAEIQKAAHLAHAAEFIDQLPQKYATLVGERGIKLSGGERQRIAIARAMLADSPILVLDEATSSLDSVSEKLIQDALKKLVRGKTVIVVAHRLSTIKSVDRILVFEGGRIVEEGSHAQLTRRKNGVYRELYELQAGGFIGE